MDKKVTPDLRRGNNSVKFKTKTIVSNLTSYPKLAKSKFDKSLFAYKDSRKIRKGTKFLYHHFSYLFQSLQLSRSYIY